MDYFLFKVALLKLIDVVPNISLKILPLHTPFNDIASPDFIFFTFSISVFAKEKIA